jgi:phage/plasmid-like protein (TIGR03299 family)
MAHEVVKMTYAYVEGSKNPLYAHPWHKFETGLSSIPVDPEASVLECARKCDALFEVEKVPNYALVDGEFVKLDTESVIHGDTKDILETKTGKGWQPHQNRPMIDYTEKLVSTNKFEHNTSGVLGNGKIVFVNLLVKDAYIKLRKDDEIFANLLFTNYHIWGKCSDVRNTNVRAVCRNTVEWAHQGHAPMEIKFSHQQEWDADKITQMLEMAKAELEEFGEAAKFLNSKACTVERMKEYYKEVFPVTQSKDSKRKPREISKMAKICEEVTDTQPGAELGAGTWWQALNAVTYAVDHLGGRSFNTQMQSAMYGQGRSIKSKALDLALEHAK